jgi:peptide/nickel transport system substrate-binding protein
VEQVLHIGRVLFLVVAVGLAGCAPARTGGPAPGAPGDTAAAAPRTQAPKRITAAIRGDPKTLNEAINFASGSASSAGVREIEQLLNSGLNLATVHGTTVPLLAETVPSLDNGLWKVLPDGRMETTHTLRANVKWHDGTPMTSEDLVFSATVARDRAVAMQHDPMWAYVDDVTASDARTIVVGWRSTFVDADKLFTQLRETRNLPMPKHLVGQAYLDDKEAFTQLPNWTLNYVGTGPYKLREFALGTHVILDANPDFVLGRPKVDQLEVKFVLDTNTMVANLLAGAIEMTLGRGLSPEQAIMVRDQWREGKVDAGLQNTTSLYTQFIGTQPQVLSDVRFRRGLLHAIDRQQMVDTFLAGLVPIAHSIVSPDEPVFKEIESSIVRYDFDPRRSVEILDGMGIAKGPDGKYRDGAQPLTVEVRTRKHDLREKMQQVIADHWNRVGLTADAVVVPEQRVNDRAYQATFPGFYFRFGGPEVDVFHGGAVALPENNFTGRSPIRYRNGEFDALIERYQTTIPAAERNRAYGEVINHMTDQLLLLSLYHEPEPVLISNRLSNVGGRRGEAIQAWNAHEWDIRQ